MCTGLHATAQLHAPLQQLQCKNCTATISLQQWTNQFGLRLENWTMVPFTGGGKILVVCSEPLAKVRGGRQEPGGIKLLPRCHH